jgi:two-component system sensor histidine kinase HupT/HoxJ
VKVQVADNGPGVAEEDMDKIFDPFFTTKPPGEGTGLGLSLSFGIVQEHGGTLRVRNRQEGGAEFRIHLSQGDDPIADQEGFDSVLHGNGTELPDEKE